jgi:hypothetical protein
MKSTVMYLVLRGLQNQRQSVFLFFFRLDSNFFTVMDAHKASDLCVLRRGR